MVMIPVKIKGIDFAVGKKIVPNSFFESYLETTDEWIRNKIGIRERRYIDDDNLAFSDLALEAAKSVLLKTGTSAKDLDLIIVSTITPDHSNVATACLIQYELEASNAAAFDISNGGCPGSIYSLVTGSKFIADGTYKNVLVISGELFSKCVNMNDRGICVYFGDGVGAALLTPCEEGYGFLSENLGADGSGYYALAAPAGGSRLPISVDILQKGLHYAKMDGKAIWNFATTIFSDTIKKSLDKINKDVSDLDFVISHQANYNIIKVGMESLGLDMSKTYTNIEHYGNTGGASVFIALTEAVNKGFIKHGDLIALVSFGGGLAYGSLIMRWD